MKSRVSRRSLVMAGAAVSAMPFLRGRAFAASPPLVRYNAASAEGRAMLKKFAAALKLMSARPMADPLSWTFQWFTHYVRGDSSKDKELAKLPPASRAFAAEVWNTCQAHGGNHLEDCFLPWHRMFVFYFERIVRAVLNDASFTMPYWNYTNPAHRVLPAAFREPAGDSNPLYRMHRKPSVNLGHPLDERQGMPSPLEPTCRQQQTYLASGGTRQGFCLNLDSGLHASVHVLVGDRQGMGDIQWAANDPVFWLHHSNIDRLWASWNAGGHGNPDGDRWRNREFAFADEKGARVSARVGDFADIAALGYAYDRLEPVPFAIAEAQPGAAAPAYAGRVGAAPPGAAAPPAEKAIAPAAPVSNMVASASGPVAIGALPEQVALNLPQTVLTAPGAGATGASPPEQAAPPRVGAARPKAAAPPPVAAAPPPPAPSAHIYLVIRNLQARAQPGVLYAVFLNVGAGAAKKSSRLGTINFFDAGMAGMVSQKFVSFDVTGIVNGNVTSKEIAVTIAPVGAPAKDAQPVIGDILLASG